MMYREKLYNNTKKYLKYVEDNKIVNIDDIINIRKKIKKTMPLEDYNYWKSVIEKKISGQDYKLNDDGVLLSSTSTAVIIKQLSDEDFKERENNFNIIRSIVSPEQRSDAWFRMRETGITASDGGCALGLNKYEPQYKFIYNKVFGKKFETNKACYWGKKYEDAVILSYMYINDCVVDDFGILEHPEYSYIKASPDGIVNPYKKDGSRCEIASRMLEIKCLVSRELKFTGNIYDNICPKYYYIQTQLQMQTTNIDECDFAQYVISEYDSREDFDEDDLEGCNFLSKSSGYEKGCVIEVLPNTLMEEDYDDEGKIKNDCVYNKANFIYPEKINMTKKEMNEWIMETLGKIEDNKELYKISDSCVRKYKLYKINYYRVDKRNCSLILRDDEWFAKNIETYRSIWEMVCYLRNNKEKAEEWKRFINMTMPKSNYKIMSKLEGMCGIKI